MRQVTTRVRCSKFQDILLHLLRGLNHYCILAGWGDILTQHHEYDPGFLYVIGIDDQTPPYKIGYSNCPGERLTAIQIGSPIELQLLFVWKAGGEASRRLEREIHDHFKDQLVRGEWFRVPLEEIKDVVRLLHPDGIEIDPLDKLLRVRIGGIHA